MGWGDVRHLVRNQAIGNPSSFSSIVSTISSFSFAPCAGPRSEKKENQEQAERGIPNPSGCTRPERSQTGTELQSGFTNPARTSLTGAGERTAALQPVLGDEAS